MSVLVVGNEILREIPMAGDAILVNGRGMRSLGVRLAQSAATRFRTSARYSHLAIYFVGSTFIHSDEQGVRMVDAMDLFDGSRRDARLLALRNVALENRILSGEQYLGTVWEKLTYYYYYRQRYNTAFWLKHVLWPNQDHTSFCSELAVKVYRNLGLWTVKRPPSRTFPVHFQQLVAHPDWRDVTGVYQDFDWSNAIAREALREVYANDPEALVEKLRSLGASVEDLDERVSALLSEEATARYDTRLQNEIVEALQDGRAHQSQAIKALLDLADLFEEDGRPELARFVRERAKMPPGPDYWNSSRP